MKMKKIFRQTALALFAFLAFCGCSKHEITFPTVDVGNNIAEVRVFNYIPNTLASNVLFNYGTINNSPIVTSGYSLAQWGSRPSSSGVFYKVDAGSVTLNLYKNAGDTDPAYTATFNVAAGKTDIYITDFNSAPILVSSGYPLGYGEDVSAVNTYVRFLNLLCETSGVPYTGKLQYQWALITKDLSGTAANVSSWANVGGPVAYGEVTDWATINISDFMSFLGHPITAIDPGQCYVYYRIVDESGNVIKVANSKGVMLDYFDYWSAYAGRHCTHIEKGIRTSKTTGLRSGVSLQYAQ